MNLEKQFMKDVLKDDIEENVKDYIFNIILNLGCNKLVTHSEYNYVVITPAFGRTDATALYEGMKDDWNYSIMPNNTYLMVLFWSD
jgi:hypothetical protein